MKKLYFIYSICGLLVSPVLALLAIPVIKINIGDTKFGFMALFWAIVGFSNIFDIGISRALLVKLSSSTSREDIIETKRYFFRSGVYSTFFIGLLVSFFLLIVLSLIRYFNLFHHLILDRYYSVIAIAIFIFPLQASISVMRSTFEALHLFKTVMYVRFIMGSSLFLIPAVSSYFTNELVYLISIVILSRFVILIYMYMKIEYLFGLQKIEWALTNVRNNFRVYYSAFRELFSYGVLFTVYLILTNISNLSDRAFVAYNKSLADSGHYSIAADMVNQLLIIPGAFTSVMSPFLSASSSMLSYDIEKKFLKKLRLVLVLMGIFSFLIFYFGDFLLSVWLKSSNNELIFKVAKVYALVLIPYTISTFFVNRILDAGIPRILLYTSIIQTPFLIVGYWLVTKNYSTESLSYVVLLRWVFDSLIMVFVYIKFVYKRVI